MNEQVAAEITTVPPRDSGLSVRGLWQVFVSPTALFQKLKDQPRILVPYLVIAVLMFVFLIMTADLIMQMQLADPAMQERLQGRPMPPEALAIMKYSTIGGGVIAMLLVPLIAAALGLFFGNFVFGGNARFSQLLSIMLYGEVIFTVGAMLALPMVLAKQSMLVSYSLAVLVSQLGPKSILYVLLSKVSVFHIWELIVVGIGLSAVYGTNSSRGLTLSILSIGMLSVLHVVATAIGSLFF